VGPIDPLLAIGLNPQERCETRASGSHDELSDASAFVAAALAVLRGEALVVVVVAGQHDVCAAKVEYLPESVEA
jgi:hypothetical protein